MCNLRTIIRNCRGPSLFKGGTVLLFMQTLSWEYHSLGNGKKRGNVTWKWSSSRQRWKVQRHIIGPLQSDVAVTLFVIYRVLIAPAAIFAQRISHNSILTSHYSMHHSKNISRCSSRWRNITPCLRATANGLNMSHCVSEKVFKGGNN